MNARCIFPLVAVLIYTGFGSSTAAAWTVPVRLAEVNTNYHDKAPFLSYDGQTLYFSRQDGPGWHHTRIFQATRENILSPLAVKEISTLTQPGAHIDYPWVSPDNLRMYYYSASPRKLHVTERTSVNDPWISGSPISELNSLGEVANPSLTPDELLILFTGLNIPGGLGGYDLWTASRANKDDQFIGINNLIEVNSSDDDYHPFITDNGLALYFASTRYGRSQLFLATRASTDESFGSPEHLSFLDSPGSSLYYPYLSSDGKMFLFARSDNGGQYDIYVSYIPEPATFLLLGLGTLVMRRTRKLRLSK